MIGCKLIVFWADINKCCKSDTSIAANSANFDAKTAIIAQNLFIVWADINKPCKSDTSIAANSANFDAKTAIIAQNLYQTQTKTYLRAEKLGLYYHATPSGLKNALPSPFIYNSATPSGLQCFI